MEQQEFKKINVNVNDYISQVYLHLFLGLFLTGIFSYLSYASGLTLKIASLGALAFVGLFFLILILVIAQYFAAKNVALSAFLYYLFSILEGVFISPIFYAYTGSDISLAFILTSLLFLGLWFVAKSNILDLRKYGTIFIVLLIIGVVASIVNIFLKNSLLELIITWFLLIVFAGLTIYDLQKLEELAETGNPFIGALSLYLDLINLFLLILELIGGKREE
ncbi:MAG: Bax inhibitor-1/YccA family protein [Nanoarchaeota archaeon]